MIEIEIICGAALGLIGVLGLVAMWATNKADKAAQKAIEEYIERKVAEKLAAAKKEDSDIVAADAKTMERLG